MVSIQVCYFRFILGRIVRLDISESGWIIPPYGKSAMDWKKSEVHITLTWGQIIDRIFLDLLE
jgi:hypothetical protein